MQTHPSALVVCDEEATAELHVKTVRYFKLVEKKSKEMDSVKININGERFGWVEPKPVCVERTNDGR